jgi:hypothetical protein
VLPATKGLVVAGRPSVSPSLADMQKGLANVKAKASSLLHKASPTASSYKSNGHAGRGWKGHNPQPPPHPGHGEGGASLHQKVSFLPSFTRRLVNKKPSRHIVPRYLLPLL